MSSGANLAVLIKALTAACSASCRSAERSTITASSTSSAPYRSGSGADTAGPMRLLPRGLGRTTRRR
ncbi:hypothetical protein [Sphaerisporangium album]|uniref:hypothetical protein n=1 Tax=Sphaerisporangium album TaxID=509200 RepID=UPI0011C02F2F|nr:hypothetical protein [Sphaerisporangium album]